MLMKQRYTHVKKIPLLTLFYYLIASSFLLAEEKTSTWVPTPEERANQSWIPSADEVLIGPGGVSVSLGMILLIRKGKEYLALKFIDTWLGNKEYEF